MTTIENPTTEKMNGSSRMTNATDSPWWIVRPSLAASLAVSFALAFAVYRFAGMAQPGLALTPHTLATLMIVLSSTPALAAVGILACVMAVRQRGRRVMQTLCALLALASFAGVGLNLVRDSRGTDPIGSMIEKALASALPSFAGK